MLEDKDLELLSNERVDTFINVVGTSIGLITLEVV